MRSAVSPWTGWSISLWAACALMGCARAQSLSDMLDGLQPACKTNVVASAAGVSGCMDILDLLKIATMSNNESVVDPLGSYITAIKDQKCSQTDLDGIKTAINDNCQADAKKPPVLILSTTVANYAAIRDLLLLQPKSKSDKWCVTTIMGKAETASDQTFSKNKLMGLFGGNAKPFLSMLNKLPESTYCDDCGKALISKTAVLMAKTNPSAVEPMTTAADERCGSGFAAKNGSIPSSVESGDTSGAYNKLIAMSTFTVAASFMSHYILLAT